MLSFKHMKFILADDWYLYYVDAENYVWYYNTEMWHEWLNVPKGTPVSYMKRFIEIHTPKRCAKIHIPASSVGEKYRQMTLDEFKGGMPKGMELAI